MLTTALTTAFVTGLLGSLHCFSMCGPLALAGCSGGRGGRARADTIGYFGGRFVSYMLLGAVMGSLGHRAMSWAPLTTIQTVALISVAAVAAWRGIGILFRVWRSRGGETEAGQGGDGVGRDGAGIPVRFTRGAPEPADSGLLSWIGSLIPRRGLGLGLATGVLPCGLLVAGWMLAAASADPVTGSLVMASFAVGSSPGLVAPLVGKRALGGRGRRLSPTWQGLAWCALAIWVGVRPLWMQAHGCH
jgi:sulfite exporter TauE/SafE